MKLPSLLKIPNYKKFNFEPRYYDPIKEEINMKTENMRRELESQKSLDKEAAAKFRYEFQETLKRKATEDRNSNILQVLFILLFFSIFVGYLFFGNNVLYITFILIPAYIIYRSRMMKRPHK